jgi:hypothetical protein
VNRHDCVHGAAAIVQIARICATVTGSGAIGDDMQNGGYARGTVRAQGCSP